MTENSPGVNRVRLAIAFLITTPISGAAGWLIGGLTGLPVWLRIVMCMTVAMILGLGLGSYRPPHQTRENPR